jgi:uncharacterized membrane protein (UPF0127 family)
MIKVSRSLHWLILILAGGLALSALAGDTDNAETAIRLDAGLVFLGRDGTQISRIDVEIADDTPSRMRGLMGRRLGDDRSGMLFIFPDSAPRSFWMRNTPGSLDILFADAQRRIINIARETEPFSDRSIRSHGPAMYVVEVRGGFARRMGISPGMRFDYYRSPTGKRERSTEAAR